jgi:hypothetical protein
MHKTNNNMITTKINKRKKNTKKGINFKKYIYIRIKTNTKVIYLGTRKRKKRNKKQKKGKRKETKEKQK